ncbi:conserved hypothetical protein [Alteracholeplasma palmae J233]|uniref:DUF6273 domain-containing protein n=1 Tax=Alteracholeplasma palmae (strain ATCC 49389 / J233) TaxID=1318466 RepID=U4KLE3_ALTPJ|nr:DUF6273 domain-containing protein [Alteracholeplasma palmae]CCV64749.1 conserved hypothetical protein [Alteracholeplasma palmae J233]
MKIGDLLLFGKYQFRVLEIDSNRALIITDEIIEKRPYHNTYESVTWETCDLRKYLNHEFYYTFTQEEQGRIIPVTNKNLNNPWYHTNGGNDTYDFIFLLDIFDVVCKYFGDSSKHLIRKSEKEKYWFAKRDENNINRLATYKGNNFWWWIRTPGRIPNTAVYIHGNPIGRVGINGNNVFFRTYTENRQGGIRPALWIKLD